NDGIPTLSSESVSVPTEIETILARACELNPSDRFATARQMIDMLEEFGKRSGHLASQTEVAEYVERMAGEALDRRRQTIADRLQGRHVALGSTQPPPPQADVATAGSMVRAPDATASR